MLESKLTGNVVRVSKNIRRMVVTHDNQQQAYEQTHNCQLQHTKQIKQTDVNTQVTHLSICNELNEFIELTSITSTHADDTLPSNGKSVQADRYFVLWISADYDNSTLQCTTAYMQCINTAFRIIAHLDFCPPEIKIIILIGTVFITRLRIPQCR